MSEFVPQNGLEIALEKARLGHLSMPDLLHILVDSDLAVPSGGEVMADGSGFRPILFDKQGVKMVACFTTKDRIGDLSRIAPYCLVTKGKEFLRRVPREYGVVVNPGLKMGFDITPDGLSKVVSDFQ